MRSLDEIISDFLVEMRNINNHKFWDDINGDSNLFPSTIGAGSGKMIRSTSRLDRYLYEIAQYIQAKNFGKIQKFNDKDIYISLREQIGPKLLEIDLDSTEALQIEIIKKFIKETSEEIPLTAQSRDYSFGCEVFNCDVDDIVIGPVSFKTRSSWLNNKLIQGKIAKNTAARAQKKWVKTNLRKRRSSLESNVEDSIINITLDYNYVCEVSTKGFGQSSGLERSLLAARISLTGIALLLDRSETAIREFNIGYDSSLFHQHYIAFNNNGVDTMFSGKSYKPGGRFVRKTQWEDVVKNESDYFKLYSEIADWVLINSNNIRHPNLMNQLAQSNFWFYEACKEKLDSIAVVKFIASMDALAKSRKLKGILQVLEFRALLAPNDPIYDDGSTVEDVLRDLYDEGRSRLIHGSTDRFRSDWSAKRITARFFAERCLLGCIRWAAQRNAGADGDDMLRA